MWFGRSARGEGRVYGRVARIAGVAGAIALLGACDRLGNPLEALGAPIPPPDEFQVTHNEPLVVPKTYSLPEPTPGAPSPRAPRPEQEAMAALLGTDATAETVVGTAAEPSPGEQRLLAAANAASASGDIRMQLQEDKRRAAESKPYEPPTVAELLGLGGDEKKIDETQVIDPEAEAERLRAEGIPVPVDPEAAARARAQADAEQAEPFPDWGPTDRVPNNRIGPPTEPAY